MKLTLKNVKELKQKSESPLFKRVCNYVISEWGNYSDKTNIFKDVLYYYQKEDFSFIMDCFGKFEKLWQFSVFVRDKGINVLEVSKDGNFLDGNMDRVEYDKENAFLRATQKGKPDYVPYEVNGTDYKAVKVDNCIYIPDKEAVM